MVVEAAVGYAAETVVGGDDGILLKYELPAVPVFPLLEPGLHFDIE